MAWYFIYDLTTGVRCGTANFHLDDSVYLAENRGQFEIPDDTKTEGMMADITQNPPVLIPDPNP